MVPGVIDLRSDTVTRPSAGMRKAIAEAVVGDDHLGDDPTTRALEERIADLLGKERALFFPSGTMANQTALAILGRAGTEAVVEAGAHVFHLEGAGAAAWSGLQLRPVAAPDGILTAELTSSAIRPLDRYLPRTSIVCLENTHGSAGGRVLPLPHMRAVFELTREKGIALHLDGARLWNAAAATGLEVDAFAACSDTVMVSLSKGLGAPVGSVLAGPVSLMEDAWGVRRRLGGAMRQSGLLAAAGLYALDHNRERLLEDHAAARDLALGVEGIEGIHPVPPDTNFVMIDIVHPEVSAEALLGFLEGHRILMTRYGLRRLRAVTHLDIENPAIERTLEVLRSALREIPE